MICSRLLLPATLIPLLSLITLNEEARALETAPSRVQIAITRVRPFRINADSQSVHPLKKINGWFQHGVQFVISARNLPAGARAIRSGLRLNLTGPYRHKTASWREVANTQLNRTSFVTMPFFTGGAVQIPQSGRFTPFVTVRFADGQEKTYWGHPGRGKSSRFWVGETTYQHALENLGASRQGKAVVNTTSSKVNREYRQYFNEGTTTTAAQ